MKKLLMMLTVAAGAALTAMADPSTETINGIKWSYECIDGHVTIVASGEYEAAVDPKPTGTLTIPSQLGGKTVTIIGDNAFLDCSGLTSVTIPDGVTSIGASAFYGCSELASVTIPSSVTRIGAWAFDWCNESLYDTATIPGVKLVDGWVVGYTDAISRDLALTGVRGIGDAAFYGCANLADSKGFVIVGGVLYGYCGHESNIAIPDGVTSIGCYAFRYRDVEPAPGSESTYTPHQYSWLTSVVIPNSVTNIGDGAFSGCTGLTSLTFEGDAPSVGQGCFYGVNSCTAHVKGCYKSWIGFIPGISNWNGLWIDYVEGYEPWYVGFHANGGKLADEAEGENVIHGFEMRFGNPWDELPMPTRTGYMFAGWFTAATGGTQVNESSTLTADMIYYAHWTPSLDLAAASEWPGEFTTDGWCGQGVVSHDGEDALRSGVVYGNQSTHITTQVTGTGRLSFWWKVSCEGDGKDALRFIVDGEQVAMISGDVDWTKVEVPITGSGVHTIKWNYTKNGSVTKGEDFGWVDQISWAAAPVEAAFVFDAQDGKFSNGATVKKTDATPGNLWGKMYMPAKDGQVFEGWYTSGGQLVTSSSVVPEYYETYYARWTKRLGLAAASEWGGEFTTDSWCGQGTVAYDGHDALRSGVIYDNQSSYLITKVTGPGTLTFWWAVSCEGGGKDALRLLVDGAQVAMISGEVDWTKVEVPITGSGVHTIKWNYTKNATVTKGEDFGWLDQISWAAAPVEEAFVFDAQGGKFSNGATVKKTDATPGNLWGKMYMPAKDGQVFAGWYTAASGGSLVTSSSAVPDYYTTYYAHWTPRLGLAAASEWGGAFETDSWCGQGAVSHDGADALRSGIIYNDQSSYILTRVTGPGTFTFWWKVSCEGGGNDKLRFLVDGVQKGSITGENDWAKVTVDITGSGTHVLKWVYSKNSTVTKGQDLAWLDQLGWQAK